MKSLIMTNERIKVNDKDKMKSKEQLIGEE
jgi:hypothetical protein